MSAPDTSSPLAPAANGLRSASCSPPLLYTREDSEKANREWSASCGPHSIAAACGITLEQVRAALVNYKGWMSPTHITQTLLRLGRVHNLRHHLKTHELCEGINRIQWEGKWLNPGVPARVAYFHTHWVAHFNGWVLCTACLPDEWLPVETWRAFVAQANKPFHITHHYQMTHECRKLPKAAKARWAKPENDRDQGIAGKSQTNPASGERSDEGPAPRTNRAEENDIQMSANIATPPDSPAGAGSSPSPVRPLL